MGDTLSRDGHTYHVIGPGTVTVPPGARVVLMSAEPVTVAVAPPDPRPAVVSVWDEQHQCWRAETAPDARG